MRHATLAASVLVAGTAAVKDGNSQGWDRLRRCDDDYGFEPRDLDNPYDTGVKCAPCEGIGGYTWGDSMDDFEATSCTVINGPDDIPTPPNPEWPREFTADSHQIVMISEISCIEIGTCIPFDNSSHPKYYEYQPMRYSLDEAGTIYQDVDFVMDSAPPPLLAPEDPTGAYEYWHYVLPPDQDQGYTQDTFIASNPVCICLAQSQAGPMTFDHMRHPEDIQTIETGYPVRYIGRELLGIEWLGPGQSTLETVVDHWVKGPHHIWTNSDGIAVRAYHAWFSLSVWYNYRDLDDQARQKITDNPHVDNPACASPAFPGISCGPVVEDAGSFRAADADYVARAKEWVPRPEYRSDNFEDMTSALNIHLEALLANSFEHQECSDFTVDEVNDVMLLIHAARDPALQAIYESANDPRSLDGATTNAALLDQHMAEKELLAAAPELEEMMRDGKCHEVVMWFIHHLSKEAQLEVGSMVSLPFLPLVRHITAGGHGAVVGASGAVSSASEAIGELYERQITCLDCHYTPALLMDVQEGTGDGAKDTLGSASIAGIAVAVSALVVIVGVASLQRHQRRQGATRGSQLLEPASDASIVAGDGHSMHSFEIASAPHLDSRPQPKRASSEYQEIASV